MIKKVLIFFVSVSLVVVLADTKLVNAQQQPPRDYSDEGEEKELEHSRDYSDDEESKAEEAAEEEPTRGHRRGESTQLQPPRKYPDDNGDGDSNKDTKP